MVWLLAAEKNSTTFFSTSVGTPGAEGQFTQKLRIFAGFPKASARRAGDLSQLQVAANSAENKNFSNFSNYSLDAGFLDCTMRILYALVTLGKWVDL